MPFNHLMFCCPLLLLPSFFPSIRIFSNESALHIRWPKYWSFSFYISPSNEYSGSISFSVGLISLLLKGLLKESSPAPQFESINSSALSLPYSPPLTSVHGYWKNHNFDYKDICQQSNVSGFNTLSRFVIAFVPRNKCLLISGLQALSTVILEPKKILSATVPPSICHEEMGLDTMILVFWMLSFKSAFSLSSFTFIKRLFSSSSLFAMRVVSSAYLRLLIFLLAILIPTSDSPSLAFYTMYSAYKLNKQSDNIRPWCAPFPTLSQSISPCLLLYNVCFCVSDSLHSEWQTLGLSTSYNRVL